MAQLPRRARRYSTPPADPHSVRSVERKQAGVGAAAAAPGHGFGLLCGSELGTVYATSRHRSWPSCPPKNGLTASDLLPVARTGSAEGSRQGEGKQVGRARGRFFGPLWLAVRDLLAVSLDRYVSPTIYLGGGRVALPDLSELGCRRPQTRPPCALSSGPLFERARRFVRLESSRKQRSKRAKRLECGLSTG